MEALGEPELNRAAVGLLVAGPVRIDSAAAATLAARRIPLRRGARPRTGPRA